MKQYTILTPYIINEDSKSYRKCNMGDGFILEAIRNLLPNAVLKRCFSTREILTDDDIAFINSTDALIIAGANQLSSSYTIAKGFTIETLKKIRVPIIPFGVGVTGNSEQCGTMSDETKSLLIEIHKRISFSSWRCPRTVEYLRAQIPEISNQLLMTGCPVVYGDHIMSDTEATKAEIRRVLFTPTERGKWFTRDIGMLLSLRRKFKNCEFYMLMQQDYRSLSVRESLTHIIKNGITPAMFYRVAKMLGVKLFFPSHALEAMALLHRMDLHVGTRLHVHLYLLGIGKRSYLRAVDQRALGFDDYLRFPNEKNMLDNNLFESGYHEYKKSAKETMRTMKIFLESLYSIQ